MELRPRRSVLYMPGANTRAMEKARSLPADALVLDLEDAVAPDAKTTAREQVVAALQTGGYGRRERVVRVNTLDSPWGADDLAAVAGVSEGLDAVLLPKVESAEQVRAAVAALDAAGARQDLSVWVMTETPRGVLDIDEIGGAHPRLRCVVMGTSDLANDMRARHTLSRVGLLAPLSLCVLAARAHGLDILDGVHLDLDDDSGLRAACQQARDMGFDGKTLIHPRQIAAANIMFAPRDAEVEHARAVLEGWESAAKEGKAVAVVNGRLVESLHVEEARRILALWEAIEQVE